MAAWILNEKVEKFTEIILLIFGLYLLFQLLRKIFGGSWSTEDIIIALIIFNTGALFTLGMLVTQTKSDLNHMRVQFRSLATDFKAHLKKKE